MEGLELLAQARAAGLTVEAQGSDLVVRGPKGAKAIALMLIKHKAAVLAAISMPTPKSVGTKGQKQCGSTERPQFTHCRTAEIDGAKCATITLANKTYELRQFHGMWFFRLSPEAGWTCCSREFVAIIEQNPNDTGHGRSSPRKEETEI